MERRVKNMLENPHKLYKDGGAVVAVLSSETCPWSTQYTDGPDPFDRDMALFLHSANRELMPFDVLLDGLTQIAKLKYPAAYMGGLRGLGITWLPVGTLFKIGIASDQSEVIEIFERGDYHVA